MVRTLVYECLEKLAKIIGWILCSLLSSREIIQDKKED